MMIIQSNSLSIHASFFSFKQTLKIIIHRHLFLLPFYTRTNKRANDLEEQLSPKMSDFETKRGRKGRKMRRSRGVIFRN